MKKLMLTTIFTLSLGASVAGYAQTPAAVITAEEATQLMTDSKCVTCHDINADKIGPAYKKVAARYAAPDDATKAYLKDTLPADYLFKKVRSGTVLFGENKNKNWINNDQGTAYGVMIPNTPEAISDDNLKKMIAFILSLK